MNPDCSNCKRLEALERNVEALSHAFQELLDRDPLTDLVGRRTFDNLLTQAIARIPRQQPNQTSLILARIDVDNFKRITETLDHKLVENILKKLSAILVNKSRKADVVARIGEKEFVIVLEDTKVAGAVDHLNELRALIYEDVRVTVSIGVAEFIPDETAETLFLRADKALYEAMHAGKNGVMLV